MVSTWISVILKLEKGHSPNTCKRHSSAWPSRISEAISEALHLEVSGTSFVIGAMEGGLKRRSSCAQQTWQYPREENSRTGRDSDTHQESHGNCL